MPAKKIKICECDNSACNNFQDCEIGGRFTCITSMRGGILSILQTHSEVFLVFWEVFRVFLGVFRVFGVFRDVPVFHVLAFLEVLHAVCMGHQIFQVHFWTIFQLQTLEETKRNINFAGKLG